MGTSLLRPASPKAGEAGGDRRKPKEIEEQFPK